MRVPPAYGTCAMVLLVLSAALACSAQYQQSNTATAVHDGMTLQGVKTGLYVISSKGSNSVLRLSGNGLILVDGQPSGNYDALRARVKRISDQPIRALILTGCDESRTGSNVKFLEDGTPIVAQENAKLTVVACNFPKGKPASPIVTYASEYRIHLGGVDAQLMHFGNARTNSDTVVYFPNLKVVAVGDLFTSVPNPDFSAGGSLVGWSSVLAQILKLDFDVVVPSTGPPVTRGDLEAFKTKIDTVVSRATGLVKKGVPKDQLMAQLKTGDLGWQFNFSGEQLDHFYSELSRTK
jgi:cyclase